MEAVVAKRILHLASQKDLFDWKAERAYKAALSLINYELTSGQHHAVGASLDNAFNIIAGGAGTGKTTVSFAVTSAYQALQYSIHPIALSGRAAMRLSESIGIETMTIARFLRGDPIDQGQGHLLVIDEASMIDIPTMYRLVVHCHPDTRMLMVGDPNQLPPIGSGKVLSDIIESDVTSVTKLDVVKRQEASSGIPEYSNIINSGEIPHNLTMGAIVFHETSSELITQKCKTIYAESPVNSRVVAPTKAVVSEINGLIQNAINPDSERMYINYQGEPFFLDYREGDQILFTENHYDKDIQNGTLGVLTSTQASPDGFGTVILDTGKSISVTESLLDCIQLGYAITLHKAQGSQFKRVIIALAPGRIVDRAWLYTAITRAEAEVHIVGSEKDLTDITKKLSNANRRKSYLSRMLMSNKNTENTATTSGANRMALNKKWEN
jgi:exodeoxyribonuclease V alpha subunit